MARRRTTPCPCGQDYAAHSVVEAIVGTPYHPHTACEVRAALGIGTLIDVGTQAAQWHFTADEVAQFVAVLAARRTREVRRSGRTARPRRRG